MGSEMCIRDRVVPPHTVNSPGGAPNRGASTSTITSEAGQASDSLGADITSQAKDMYAKLEGLISDAREEEEPDRRSSRSRRRRSS